MQNTLSSHSTNHAGGLETQELAHLNQIIEHAAHLLPAQGPITVFVHHNTLHALEDLPFEEAVVKGGRVFECHSYLSEDRYREELKRGRIRFSELQDVLQESLGESSGLDIMGLCSRFDLRLAMLQYPLQSGPTEELTWFLAEKDALHKIRSEASAANRERLIGETRRWVMRDLRWTTDSFHNGNGRSPGLNGVESLKGLLQRYGSSRIEGWNEKTWEAFSLQALWYVCCEGVQDVPTPNAQESSSIRHRELLLKATGDDADQLVNNLLIRFCAAFLDQGLAPWHLPHREEGFYRSFCTLYRQLAGPPDHWMWGLPKELARLEDETITPLQCIQESLQQLGVPEVEWEEFLSNTFLSLRGWGGMVKQIEERSDRAVQPIPKGSLVEFLAIRLVLDRFALAFKARQTFGYQGPLSGLRDEIRRHLGQLRLPSVEQRAFQIFQLAQVLGLSPDVLHRLDHQEWIRLVQEIEAFSVLERQKIFHLAYERRFVTQTLDAIALHAPEHRTRPKNPRFQVICCLDDREESFRRHMEEIAPDVETFGAAGFFSVAIYYRGAADAHFTPLCPVVIHPQHWVCETVEDNQGETHRRRAGARKALGTASHQFHIGTRSFALGALLSSAVGVLASIPLLGRILFPRLTGRIRKMFGRIVQTPPQTLLQLERTDPIAGPEPGHVGFTVEEMASCAERILRDMGLTSGFSRLVLFIGHGSRSLNNPHNSAYNCGACSGAAGGPNARTIAQILNDQRVREKLELKGLPIPEETVFVGGYHNTCDDSVIYYDAYRIPESHIQDFMAAKRDLDEACQRNAHERCRRFLSAPLTMSFATAREHVEERSEDLAQTRPECGHATNSLSIVGRREWSRGLYLDRRAFLTSYDPKQDDAENTILTRILSAVFPVCAGINLEYYFSYVDNTGWGCGTKLPHNIAALLGVMDGPASDLRTGLPWQMVEIHEPVRLLFIIETTTKAMEAIIDKNKGIGILCRNGWVLLAVLDPETCRLSLYKNGTFQDYQTQAEDLPRSPSSVDWYRGWRDHLEFAQIKS